MGMDVEARKGFISGLIREAAIAVKDSTESDNGRANLRLMCAVAKGSPRALEEVVNAVGEELLDKSKGREDRERAEAAADALGEVYAAADRGVSSVPCPIGVRAAVHFEVMRELGIEGRSVSGIRAATKLAMATPEATIGNEEAGGFCAELADFITMEEEVRGKR